MAEIDDDLSTERLYCMEVTWKLRNFLRTPANVNSVLESKAFSLAKADWRLLLFPNGSTENNSEGYIDIYLWRENFTVAQQRVKATFSLKSRKSKNCKICSFSMVYDQKYDSLEMIKFIKRSNLEKKKHFLLPEGTLTVHCEIKVEPSSDDNGASGEESPEIGSSLERIGNGAITSQHLDASSQTEMSDACQTPGDLLRTSPSIQKLQTDYKKLLESKKDSDVCLTVSDKDFRAHKCILGARSPVFCAMFEHDTEEKNSGKVVIKDLDPESFPDFLQHIYSGSTDELSVDNVFNLFTAADKYDLADLRSECKDFMKSTLSVDTFCDVMIMALRYREDDLLKIAINFFSENLARIIVTVKWQKFLKEHDTAANELLIKTFVPPNKE